MQMLSEDNLSEHGAQCTNTCLSAAAMQMLLTMWANAVQLSGSDRVVAASCCTMHRCHHPKTPGHLGPMVSYPVGIRTPTWLQSFLIGTDPMEPHGRVRGKGAAARSGAKKPKWLGSALCMVFVDGQPYGKTTLRVWNSLVDYKPQWMDVCCFWVHLDTGNDRLKEQHSQVITLCYCASP